MKAPKRSDKGYKGYMEASKDGKYLWVGAEGPKPKTDEGTQYRGPVAHISFDQDWLHITTDDYEGHAMLNIEALPYLRRALAKLARKLKEQSK